MQPPERQIVIYSKPQQWLKDSFTNKKALDANGEGQVSNVIAFERPKAKEVLGCFSDSISQGRHLIQDIVSRLPKKQPFQDPVFNGEGLIYGAGERVKEQFDQVVDRLISLVGGRRFNPGLKGRGRIRDKAKNKYDGQYVKLCDIVRDSLEVDSIEDVYRVIQRIHGVAKIRFVKDRFLTPQDSGYSDVKLLLEFNDPHTGKPYMTELQLHIPEMLEAKKLETALFNESRRAAERLNSDKSLGPAEKMELENKVAFLAGESRRVYKVAAEKYWQRQNQTVANGSSYNHDPNGGAALPIQNGQIFTDDSAPAA